MTPGRRVLEQLFGYERSPFYGEKLKADYQQVEYNWFRFF
jgi:hypothetical protein